MSLVNEDLKNTVLPKISIDEFEPNAGSVKEVIVVAFYLNDKDPAEDLNTFMQRGFVDNLDIEVSPNTDENGNYLVFVEMLRNETFPEKFKALVKDVENLSGKLDWKITTYLSGDKSFGIDDDKLFKYVILNPKEYVTRAEFNMNDEKNEKILEFFRNSLANNLTISGNYVTVIGNNRRITFEMVDVGTYDDIITRNLLTESAFKIQNIPHEVHILKNILGDYEVFPIGNFLSISQQDNLMLVKNAHISYKERNFG